MSVCAVVGGQFGSEGKGLIVGEIAKDYGHHVRVGAANAGHTLYTQTGVDDDVAMGSLPRFHEKHVMQQLPCAAYANPEATLYIGPGALISLEIFVRELDRLWTWRREHGLPTPVVYVDPRAHVITEEQIVAEQQTGLAERIGSTSTIAREGIGIAAADRVLRAERCVRITDRQAFDLFGRWAGEIASPENARDASFGFQVRDVPMTLARDRVKMGNYHILLEGTQGTGLSNTTGFFPYCTSRNTTVAGLCGDAGIAPTHVDRVILVCRAYPIRVAGNSGPFYVGSQEIAWSDIGIDAENERTTVTKKVRRVATFSMDQVDEAVVLNGATEIALTFADYIDPEIAGYRGESGEATSLDAWPKVAQLVDDIEEVTQTPVTFIGTGPHSVIHYPSPYRLRAAA